jgi:histidinol-phosphate phosphatase family protein
MRKCVFFDRDGIVNESPGTGYVERWEDFRLLSGFVDVLRLVTEHGYDAVVVSNQRGVALGVMTRAAVDGIHENLCTVLARDHGLHLLDILYCPHDKGECDCRKPQPGMLLTAARRHGIDLTVSWMVGDRERDVAAGKRAGCRTVLVSPDAAGTQAEFHVRDMAALQRLVAERF